MTAAEFRDEVDAEEPSGVSPLGLAPEPVEVRRNAGLAAFLGAVASAVAIAYLARATGTGSVLDWGLAAVMGVLGVTHLASFVDARTPLVVADTQGVRIRLGRSWRGFPWGAVTRVEHTPRRGLLRDGRLVLVVRNPERLIEELDRSGRRQSRLCKRLYGAPFAVPLALSTRTTGAGDDLTAALTRLSGESSRVVEISPTVEETRADESASSVEEPRADESGGFEPCEEVAQDPDPPVVEEGAQRPLVPEEVAQQSLVPEEVAQRPSRRARRARNPVPDQSTATRRQRLSHPGPAIAHAINVIGARLQRSRADADPSPDDLADQPEPLVASATPSPLRDPVSAQRAEVRREATVEVDDLEGKELRRPGSVSLVEDPEVWGDRVRPIARAGAPVEPLVIDEFAAEPAEDPVVGPELAAARTRLRLTVDQLAERTRIRPHVIESIEVDDFAPCGGDFYARGHLRTLARVLGVDVTPLLTAYDERYADAPIDPRRVFEAELAKGSIRGTRGGPNWSILVAAVMALVLAWSIARLIMDSPVDLRGAAPVLNGSAGVDNGSRRAAPEVPVVLSAAGGGAHVVVRDGSSRVVFTGDLAFGETRTLSVSPPVLVQSSDGSVEIAVDGEDKGPLGATGKRATNTFPVS